MVNGHFRGNILKKCSISQCLNIDTKSVKRDWKVNPIPSLLVFLLCGKTSLCLWFLYTLCCHQTRLPSNVFGGWLTWSPLLESNRKFHKCNKVWHHQLSWVFKNFLPVESAKMECEGFRSVTMWGTEEQGRGLWQGQRRGGVMGPQNPGKKKWSRHCPREDEIKSYS